MSSKKKLIISLSVAAAVLLCAIIAIVAVFAAGQQAVNTKFTIKFTATDVDATVMAYDKTGNGSYGSNPFKSATFTASTDNTSAVDLSPTSVPTLENTEAKNTYSIKYVISNNSTNALVVKLTDSINTGDSGFTISFTDGDGTTIEMNSLINDGITVDGATETEGQRTAGTATIIITISIPKDTNKDASLELDYTFSLVNSSASVSQ